MKIIDAINKINKEEKFRFRLLCDGDIYKYIGGSLYNETVGERAEWIIDNEWLNQEVEIIEEEKKIPEKLNNGYQKTAIEDMKEARFNSNDMAKICNRIGWLMENRNELSNKIDEIIDYLKAKEIK